MKKTTLFILLILLLHLILLIHLRFTAWPEMILWPYLTNKGLLLYKDIVIIYPSLLLNVLDFLGNILGVTLFNLKIYTWVIILLTDFLVYFSAKKIFKKEKAAFVSLIFYILWQPYFEGNALWFDLVLAPLAILVFDFLFEKKYFWGGLFLGLSLVVKQTAIYFLPPIFLTFFFLGNLKRKPFLHFIVGAMIPLGGLFFYLVGKGLVRDFYQWAINFGVFYLPRASGQIEFPTVKNLLAVGVPYSLALFSILTLLCYRNEVRDKEKMLVLLLVWCGFGILGIYPRWEYFHFQPSLPFLALISGWCLENLKELCPKPKKLFSVFLVLIIIGTFYLQQRFYRLNWQKPTRFFDNQTLELASWITNHTKPSEKIYILNCWDHLYALSGTLPAVSPLIHTLPWHLEYPGMQEKYVSDLENVKPKMVIVCPYSQTGLGSYRPQKIDNYLKTSYILTNIVEERFLILGPK